MRTRGRFINASKTLEGDLSLTFVVDDEAQESLESIKDVELVIEVDKYKKKRSLNANAYLWQLCDKIAKKLSSDKETIYLLMIKDAGVFETIEVIKEGIPMLQPLFRLIEEDYEYEASVFDADGNERIVTMASIRCYKGSHEYDTKQMSELIDMTVSYAHDLGIETMTQDEIQHLCSAWEAR